CSRWPRVPHLACSRYRGAPCRRPPMLRLVVAFLALVVTIPTTMNNGERDARRQIHFGERRQETKRRLQRRVKSVSAWLTRELRPFGRGERGVMRLTQPFAGVAVIAEEAGAEAIERGIGRRHEIDRVSPLVHGASRRSRDRPRAHRAVTMMSACARCTRRPATVVATTRGCPTADASTMIKSARRPGAICPRSLSLTALAGVCDTSAQACPNGRTP